MFHAQQFNPNALGISWVDLVFPFFLFAMGAAIPVTTNKITKWSVASLSPVVRRTAMLILFSIAIGSLRPTALGDGKGQLTLWWSLAFFVAFGLAYLRTPWNVVRKAGPAIWLVGIIVLIWGMLTWRYPTGAPGFDWGRQDIIIMVLAQVSLTTTLIWHVTRRQPLIRLLVVMAVMMLFLTKDNPGSSHDIWYFPSQPGLLFTKIYKGEFQKYLMIALPGTILGDYLLIRPEIKPERFKYLILTAVISIVTVVVMVVLLYTRFVWAGILVTLAVGPAGLYLLREVIWTKGLWLWGFVLLTLGLLAEPHGGGIQKDSATLSYFFTTSGLAFWTYVSLDTWYRVVGAQKPGFFAKVGANPLLGYAAITNLVFPTIRLTGLYDLSANWNLAAQTGFAVAQTLMVGAVCWLASSVKVYLRA